MAKLPCDLPMGGPWQGEAEDWVIENHLPATYRTYVLSRPDDDIHEQPLTVEVHWDGRFRLWVGEYSRHLNKAEREQLAALLTMET